MHDFRKEMYTAPASIVKENFTNFNPFLCQRHNEKHDELDIHMFRIQSLSKEQYKGAHQ